MSNEALWTMGIDSIKKLEDDRGILASARTEVYGCIFGRDSLITSLKLLRAYERTQNQYFLDLVKKILLNLAQLQGERFELESGEAPGKIIHEYRPTDHERLTKHPLNPWYVYPDGTMRNYDSVDSTPLFLMTTYEYYRLSHDDAFISSILPQVTRALTWVLEVGDSNADGFIDYQFDPARSFGGLTSQSWMDSAESVFFENYDELPKFPIAPVEAQAYAFAALRAWGNYFAQTDTVYGKLLDDRATALKQKFNQAFVLHGVKYPSLSYALDGRSRPLTSPRSSMGHCLFAVWKHDGVVESILEDQYIPSIVRRLLSPDLYVRSAGIRTLSSRSKRYDPYSYHNGSIWPHDTTMVAQGLANFGYIEEAKQVRASIARAYSHFETPIELFVYAQRKFGEYMSPSGQGACRTQAWSAAALLSML